MPVNVKRKDPAAVALGRKCARWAKANGGSGHKVPKSNKTGMEKVGRFSAEEMSEAAPATPFPDASRKALHICLKRIKDAKNEDDLRRLTEELQRIVFHTQYLNA